MRDLFLHLEPRDIDFVVEGVYEEQLKLFARSFDWAIPTGESHGTFMFQCEGEKYEVSVVENISLASSDYTINSMLINADYEVVDFHGGENDLEYGILRMTQRIALIADPVRVIRGIRFKHSLDLQIHPDTKDAMEQVAPQMKMLEDARANKDLGQLLEEAQAKLEVAKVRIPDEKDSTDVTQILMEFAERTGVDVFPVAGRVQKASTTTIGGKEYYVVSFNLTPKGSYDQVMDFIELVESGSETENISIEYTTLVDSGISWSAQINGKFYSRVAEGD